MKHNRHPLIDVDCASRGLEARLVAISALVKPGVETHVDHSIPLLIVDPLNTKGLEEERFGFLEDLLSLLS